MKTTFMQGAHADTNRIAALLLIYAACIVVPLLIAALAYQFYTYATRPVPVPAVALTVSQPDAAGLAGVKNASNTLENPAALAVGTTPVATPPSPAVAVGDGSVQGPR